MNLRKKLFWIVSRSSLFLYSRFPIFGPLRAALGIVHREGEWLVIERNDGRGLSFPGGLALPWENPEQAAVREVLEETGLRVLESELRLAYYSSADVPVNISVFNVRVEGELKASWEGTPRWLSLPEIRSRLIPAQQRILETLQP